MSIESEIEELRGLFDNETIEALKKMYKIKRDFLDLTKGLEKKGINWAEIIQEERNK